jgi:hypothetical protein
MNPLTANRLLRWLCLVYYFSPFCRFRRGGYADGYTIRYFVIFRWPRDGDDDDKFRDDIFILPTNITIKCRLHKKEKKKKKEGKIKLEFSFPNGRYTI